MRRWPNIIWSINLGPMYYVQYSASVGLRVELITVKTHIHHVWISVLKTQDSKFDPWRSEAEHATSRSRKLPTILRLCEWAGRNFRFFAVVKTACLESRRSQIRTPLWHASIKETKYFFPAHSLRFNMVGSLRDREVVCSASDHQGSNFEFCGLRAVTSHSYHHPQEVILGSPGPV